MDFEFPPCGATKLRRHKTWAFVYFSTHEGFRHEVLLMPKQLVYRRRRFPGTGLDPQRAIKSSSNIYIFSILATESPRRHHHRGNPKRYMTLWLMHLYT
jgi:hypothetical protein